MSSRSQAPNNTDTTRVNDQIRISPLRVIDANGESLGIISRDEAIDAARRQDLDLVEVASQERPPVCKIMDYGKYKYEQTKKLRKAQKTQSQLKEIRVRPRCGQADLDTKIRHARDFLGHRHKVMITVQFRGRELAHVELGLELVKSMVAELGDVAKVERHPTRDGRRITAILSPR
ncbi:Translation initiation factor IF-3 [Planctomycetes bacterium Pan216]|uniref:Translation initiation factor IF-3 n=1 Tax=Kolteria novifilia TaxID=2527975 RepID=A0A518AXL1_9BACT|nr:Translation initiation factor IF-3 [Planctomycetes bacterium Pan216]